MTEGELCHRCHKREGTERFYCPRPWYKTSIAGAQLKLSMSRTIGCDICWNEFTKILEEARDRPWVK